MVIPFAILLSGASNTSHVFIAAPENGVAGVSLKGEKCSGYHSRVLKAL